MRRRWHSEPTCDACYFQPRIIAVTIRTLQLRCNVVGTESIRLCVFIKGADHHANDADLGGIGQPTTGDVKKGSATVGCNANTPVPRAGSRTPRSRATRPTPPRSVTP